MSYSPSSVAVAVPSDGRPTCPFSIPSTARLPHSPQRLSRREPPGHADVEGVQRHLHPQGKEPEDPAPGSQARGRPPAPKSQGGFVDLLCQILTVRTS